VALVTSPLHTTRACAAFEAAGLKVVCVPADDREVSLGSLSAPARLMLFREWLHERAGMAWRRLRGKPHAV
jgi:uncharacterized SAM-binding protein YcdF (DUF218 family)